MSHMPLEARARRGEDADGVDEGERVDAIGDNGVSADDSQDDGDADEEAASQVCADATECDRKKSTMMAGII
jgi:hypothetical protein